MTMRSNMVALAAGFALALSAAVACGEAQGLPVFDIEASCREAGSPEICAKAEREAAALLRERWPQLSQAGRTNCIAVGRATDGGSYLATLGCLRKEINGD